MGPRAEFCGVDELRRPQFRERNPLKHGLGGGGGFLDAYSRKAQLQQIRQRRAAPAFRQSHHEPVRVRLFDQFPQVSQPSQPRNGRIEIRIRLLVDAAATK
jgi:hypothetical protein